MHAIDGKSLYITVLIEFFRQGSVRRIEKKVLIHELILDIKMLTSSVLLEGQQLRIFLL